LLETISGYFTRGADNARLKREVELARVRLVEAAAVKEENARLKAVLGLANREPRPVAITRLIGSTAASGRRFAVLGVGASEGVRVGMPVRAPLGLVGRVLEVGSASARVLLITDSESIVPVRRAGDGVPAFATGQADGTIRLRLINLGINPLKPGDPFVTSGAGGLYRPDTAFAVVTRLLPDGAMARPLADPGTTEFVVVDPVWEASQVGADLPPLPAPATRRR
jgi:rod shape-determining protein MreC